MFVFYLIPFPYCRFRVLPFPQLLRSKFSKNKMKTRITDKIKEEVSQRGFTDKTMSLYGMLFFVRVRLFVVALYLLLSLLQSLQRLTTFRTF